MSNVFGIQNKRQIDSLIELLGSEEECEKFGLAYRDDDDIWQLSVAGLGFLLFSAQSEKNSSRDVAKAFAAGYQCAMEDAVPSASNHSE